MKNCPSTGSGGIMMNQVANHFELLEIMRYINLRTGDKEMISTPYPQMKDYYFFGQIIFLLNIHLFQKNPSLLPNNI